MFCLQYFQLFLQEKEYWKVSEQKCHQKKFLKFQDYISKLFEMDFS